MSLLDIRKIVVQIEETHQEMARPVASPTRKVTVAAVIRNPYAGGYVEDLEPLYDLGAEIGGLLAERGVRALGVKPGEIESYGKAAIVGVKGEIEHAAAILHPRFGAPVRAAVEKGDDLIPVIQITDPLRGSRSSHPGRHAAQRDGVPSGKRRNAPGAAICPTRRAACFCPLAALRAA